jgi:hypothetical protein
MNAVGRNTGKLVSDLKRVVRDSEELLELTSDAVGEKARKFRAFERNSQNGQQDLSRTGRSIDSNRQSCG